MRWRDDAGQQGYSKSHSDGLILERLLQEARELNFLACFSKGMLIQYKPEECGVPGVSHLSRGSERLHFKNATDKTDRIINQLEMHTNSCAFTLPGVCWLCLFAGVVNQRCVVRGANTSRTEGGKKKTQTLVSSATGGQGTKTGDAR